MNKSFVDAIPYTVLKELFTAIDHIDDRDMSTLMGRIAVQSDIDRLFQLHDQFKAAISTDMAKSSTCFFVYAEFQLAIRLDELQHKIDPVTFGTAPPGNNAFKTFTWLYEALTRLAKVAQDDQKYSREKSLLFFRLRDAVIYEHALIFGSFARITVQQQVLDACVRWDFDVGHARIH